MNFLSHLYLSGNSEGLLIGNFIADSVKGSDYLQYPEEIKKGILLHRKIDTFTDTHHVVEISKSRLRERYRKYAPVIVDVYYDHFLAAGWSRWSDEPLDQYVNKIYALMQKNIGWLPEKSAQFTKYMIRYNILEGYSHTSGIKTVLEGMSRRARFQSDMERSIIDLEEHYSLFSNEFDTFFPELKAFTEKEIRLL
jgi:acyl carrier protein phosphodiesterase